MRPVTLGAGQHRCVLGPCRYAKLRGPRSVVVFRRCGTVNNLQNAAWTHCLQSFFEIGKEAACHVAVNDAVV